RHDEEHVARGGFEKDVRNNPERQLRPGRNQQRRSADNGKGEGYRNLGDQQQEQSDGSERGSHCTASALSDCSPGSRFISVSTMRRMQNRPHPRGTQIRDHPTGQSITPKMVSLAAKAS